jgi:hypothetical protein
VKRPPLCVGSRQLPLASAHQGAPLKHRSRGPSPNPPDVRGRDAQLFASPCRRKLVGSSYTAPVMTQVAFAALAGVTQPAVAKALKAGHLAASPGQRGIDEQHPINRAWVSLRRNGYSANGRALQTWRGPKKRAPAPGLFEDWAAVHIDQAAADRLLAIVAASGDGVQLVRLLVAMMEGLRAAVAEQIGALRAEMQTER